MRVRDQVTRLALRAFIPCMGEFQVHRLVMRSVRAERVKITKTFASLYQKHVPCAPMDTQHLKQRGRTWYARLAESG